MKTKYLVIVPLTLLIVLTNRKTNGEKVEATDSAPYEDPSKIRLSFRGEFRKVFGFTCAASNDFSQSTVCSPMGAYLPLGKFLIGAVMKSPAEKQLMKAIAESMKRHKVLNTFSALVRTMSEMLGGVHMDIASHMFLPKNGGKVSQMFESMTTETFEKTKAVHYIDMNDPILESKQINAWVSYRTHGKITHIVDPADITSNSQIILVNAVYFSGAWESAFATVKHDTFHAPDRSVTLPLMNTEDYYQYGYSKTLESEVVLIPFQGSKVIFYIFKSNKENGYKVLASKLKQSPGLVTHIILKLKRVNLTMPQFTYQYSTDLKPLYLKCNLRAIFDPNVGLGQVISGKTMYISRAVHKVGIEIGGGGHSKPPKLKKTKESVLQFIANRPFVYIIASGKHVLFTGKFTGIT